MRNKEDRAEALKMVGDLLELNLRDNLTQNSRDNLSKKKINVTKDDGECFGTSLHFISNVLNLDEMDETKIVDLANQYREGVPARAAANQTLYEAIRVKTTQESVNKFLGALRRDQKRPILNCNFDYVRNKSEFLFERLKIHLIWN
ncbi:MAG: hypothetical protein HWD61_08435 [Parachlamydiaceae bacterium]|nr:MAG: hypothetical protein HWD61_08435 [Parachlamydiaceae bacterium]